MKKRLTHIKEKAAVLGYRLFLLAAIALLPALASGEGIAVVIDAGDNEALITAIENANAGTGPTLIFVTPGPDGETTFTFTMPYMGTDSALPSITRTDIELFPINSRNPTVTFERSPDAEPFRFASVTGNGGLGMGLFNVEGFNSSGNGGAIRADGDSLVNLRGTRFRNNFAGGSGGAISIEGGSRLIVRGSGRFSAEGPSSFTENRAGSFGGAVNIVGQGTGSIKHSVFADNDAGLFGCDVNLASSSTTLLGNTMQLENNTFAGDCPNVLLENPLGRLSLRNNTFGGRGDAIDSTDFVRLFGNIFAVEPTTQFPMVRSPAPSTPLATCNDFGSNAFVSAGFNLENGDACFLDQPTDLVNTDPGITLVDDVYVLQANSAAIDAGASEQTLQPEEKGGLPCGYVDALGLGRPQDGNGDGVYQCDIGNVEVQGGPDIGPAQSGSYFDPARNGEGRFLEILDDGLAWVGEFTYATDGSGPAWFVGLGSQVGNSVVFDELLQPLGGVWGEGFDPDAIERVGIGSMALVFSNCASGSARPGKATLESDSLSEFGDLFVDATRLTTVIGCNGNQTARAGRSGSFFDPDRSGEGIFVQWLTNGSVVLIWYAFDPDGNQFWTISGEVEVTGNSVTAQMLYPATSTRYGAQFDPDEIDLQPWGTVTLTYASGCSDVEVDYASDLPAFGSGAYSYTRLTAIATANCDL